MRGVVVKSPPPISSAGSNSVLPTTMQWSISGLGLGTCLDMVKMWGPSDGSAGDPNGLDTTEVPDDLPISLLYGSRF